MPCSPFGLQRPSTKGWAKVASTGPWAVSSCLEERSGDGDGSRTGSWRAARLRKQAPRSRKEGRPASLAPAPALPQHRSTRVLALPSALDPLLPPACTRAFARGSEGLCKWPAAPSCTRARRAGRPVPLPRLFALPTDHTLARTRSPLATSRIAPQRPLKSTRIRASQAPARKPRPLSPTAAPLPPPRPRVSPVDRPPTPPAPHGRCPPARRR